MEPGSTGASPHRVRWPDGGEWHGRLEGDRFHVEDLVDDGHSYRERTGSRPPFRPVSLAHIQDAGGEVLA